jgi:2'-5' RNA ligase
MQAIVSALDDPAREHVEDIWGELKAVFGLKDVIGAQHPHFTYHAAERYASDVDEALARVAADLAPYDVQTSGLGVFRGDETILYLGIVRDGAIDGAHERILRDAAAGATEPRTYYAPETWLPHVTLAAGDLHEEQLPDIMRFLGRREYRWTIPVTNICLIPDTTATARDWRRFDLRGAPARPAR